MTVRFPLHPGPREDLAKLRVQSRRARRAYCVPVAVRPSSPSPSPPPPLDPQVPSANLLNRTEGPSGFTSPLRLPPPPPPPLLLPLPVALPYSLSPFPSRALPPRRLELALGAGAGPTSSQTRRRTTLWSPPPPYRSPLRVPLPYPFSPHFVVRPGPLQGAGGTAHGPACGKHRSPPARGALIRWARRRSARSRRTRPPRSRACTSRSAAASAGRASG